VMIAFVAVLFGLSADELVLMTGVV
jgi:hypothetical protein